MTNPTSGRRGGPRAAAAAALLLLTGCGGADQATENAGIGNATSGAPGLGTLSPIAPPVHFGFSSVPPNPQLVAVTTSIVS